MSSTKTTKSRTPKLLLKTTSKTATPVISTAPMSISSATGSFFLPMMRNHRKGGRNNHKHLRKPPSFETYLHTPISSTTITPCGYFTSRSPSLSSSYSSTTSLVDEDNNYSYGKSGISTMTVPRVRRGSSATLKVRFADASDDGSSFVSSSSAEDFDLYEEEEEEEEEEFIFVPPSRHYSYHKKSVSS